MAVAAYLEAGRRRAFAGALEWPGWCRAARDEEGALAALAAYADRYRTVVATFAGGIKPPPARATFEVVERLSGDATTDFGAPGKAPAADDEPLTAGQARRLVALLEAGWRAFDAAADAAVGAALRKGPRGGGRELDAIREHVLEADRAYLSSLGGVRDDDVRGRFVETVLLRARGEPPPKPKRSGTLWSPRYAIRRSAWHALDHAWEIEDRAS